MTNQMKAAMAAMLMVGSVAMQAQTTAGTSTTSTKKNHKPVKKAPAESATTRELRELREKQAAQQAQIDRLTNQLSAKDAEVQAAQQTAVTAATTAQAATAQAQAVTATVQSNTDAVQALKSNVTDLQTANVGLATTISANKQEIVDKIDSPTTIHYKGITIMPVAFFAAEAVYRSRSINSDINTPFNTTPYMGANEARVSEFNFSGRQSRIGGLFTGDAGSVKMSGYFEADFLGVGTSSNSNQSNSYPLRQRQIWGQAATKSGFTFTGGQMWSLVTETGKSTDNRTEKLPNTIDAQYHVGFNWARQPAVRFQQKMASADGKSALTFAMSLEQSQLTNETSQIGATNIIFAGTGTNGGLFNNTTTYTNNLAPDMFFKVAADLPKAHFEVGGVARFFRGRIYPAVANAPAGYVAVAGATPYNSTTLAGGVFGNARVTTSKYLDLALSVMGGDGVGRYGTSQLADATVRPNGTIEPIRNYHGLFSIESHPTPKLDVYGYAGAEYAQRTVYATGVAATPYQGYGTLNATLTGCNTEPIAGAVSTTGGSPTAANCSASTRDIIEGTAGFTYRIYASPKFGRIQYQATYSYLTKSAWTGLTSGAFGVAGSTLGSPKATNNMVFTSFRYYIP